MENAEFTFTESVQWNRRFPENPPGPHRVMEKTIVCLIKSMHCSKFGF